MPLLFARARAWMKYTAGFLGGLFPTPLYHLHPCRRACAGWPRAGRSGGEAMTLRVAGMSLCLCRHSGEGSPEQNHQGNRNEIKDYRDRSIPSSVIPAKAGIQWCIQAIPAKREWQQRYYRRTGGNCNRPNIPASFPWIPACAGMTVGAEVRNLAGIAKGLSG